MRIVTRGDFDGLVSSLLLTEVEQITEIRMAHPKDAQDGQVFADDKDIIVNLPFIVGCGMWFDHHVSESKTLPKEFTFKGRFEMAPSCARVIYNHYKPQHAAKLDRFAELLKAADRLDSAQLTLEDVTQPEGYILLGLTLDPRTGLGPSFQKYFRWLAEYLKEVPVAKVLAHREVAQRVKRVLEEQTEFKALLQKHARAEGSVVVTDLRGIRKIPAGNRFLVFTLFPKASVEVRIFEGHHGCVVVAVGRSIFNRSCKLNIGNLLYEYGGGGHAGAGTAQLDPRTAEQRIAEIIARLKKRK